MANSTKSDRKSAIAAAARVHGFEAVGFARAALPAEASAGLARFLHRGHHGSMAWMQSHHARRASPSALWPEAKSVIMLAANYGPLEDPRAALADPACGAISVYARGDDYHDVLKKKLRALAGWIASEFAADVKLFVDTAPVMEKPLAAQAGLGWQGKHTNLVSREFGSWLFLASIFTTLELDPDAPHEDRCGGCRRCLDACPTQAFPAPYEIDARRCISYLTIELKDPVPREFRKAIGNRIYGCDDCLAACPWNKFAQTASEAKFHARSELASASLAGLARLDETGFRTLFRASPIKRIGRDRLVRNVLIAIGNASEPALAVEAEALLTDPSALVRGAAIWALSQLLPGVRFAVLEERHAAGETDPDVRSEWQAGLDL